MNRLAVEAGAVSLAQGFPDFACPIELKEAAVRAIHDDINQYAITWGAQALRAAIAAKVEHFHPGWRIDPETQITVTCGATEAMIATMLGLLNPGDEVVIFEPFYENYGPDAILAGAVPRYVTLHRARLVDRPRRAAGGIHGPDPGDDRQLAPQPHRQGLLAGRARADRRRYASSTTLLAITDDIYQHIVFSGEHIPLATLPGMAERTIAIDSLSKTYSVTGWRVGWTIASPELTVGIRRVHDFLTVGAAAPLQQAAVVAMAFPDSYYQQLATDYRARRDLIVPALEAAGLPRLAPGRRVLRDDRHLRRSPTSTT